MAQDIHPLLLCGGSGTRLWPLSHKSYPKQFTRLTGAESLFQASVRRLSGPGFAAPVVITAGDYRFVVTEQLAGAETIDGEVRMVTENQSVYIYWGAVHRMENLGKVPMILIEVQTGTYRGEDDITCYEDIYARGGGAKG